MPTSDHVDVLDPTTIGQARVLFLLDLTVAGRVYRISSDYFEVEHEDGSLLAYVDGFEGVDWAERLSLFADSPGDVSLSFSVLLPDVDWAELAAQGHDLARGTAEVSRWVEGTPYGHRQLLLRGVVKEPVYGALGEPLAFSVVTAPLQDASSWPPADCVIDEVTWPDAPVDVWGTVYPFVIGTPGWVQGADGGRLAGSPAPLIKYEGIADPREVKLWFMVAGHRVRASKVWWRDVADPVSVWKSADVEEVEDGKGRTISYINLGHTGVTPEHFESLDAAESADVWISWAPVAGGHIQVVGSGDLLDNETFTISDGTTSITFEFEVTGGFVASGGGVVVVDVTDEDNPQLTRDQMVDQINAQDFGVRATRGGTYFNETDPANPIPLVSFVVLVNESAGTAGNVSIGETVAHLSFDSTGMEGGLATYGGMEDPIGGSGMLTGAGSVTQFFLSQSRQRVDWGRWAAVRSFLDSFEVSLYVDEFVSPWEYVQAHLTEMLPISILLGPDGLYPVVWRHDVSALRNAVQDFDVARLDAERVGPVEVSDPADCANYISVAWALNAADDKHSRTETIDGSASGANHVSRVSHGRYGRQERSIQSDMIYDSATARAVASWLSYAYGLPTRRVSYAVPAPGALHLSLGTVVALTDAELHFAGSLWHVVGLRDADDGLLVVTLRSIEGAR